MPSPSMSPPLWLSGTPLLLKSNGSGSTESGKPSRSWSAGAADDGGARSLFLGTHVPAIIVPVTWAKKNDRLPEDRESNASRSRFVRGTPATSWTASERGVVHSANPPSMRVLDDTEPRYPTSRGDGDLRMGTAASGAPTSPGPATNGPRASPG